MASKRQMIGTSADHLHNLDADKVLNRFGKYGKYQMCVYMMASLNFFLFSFKTTIISLIGDPPSNCSSPTNNSHFDANVDQNYITLASEFGLRCDQEHLLDHANGAFMLGNFVFTPFATYLADRYGRRLTFLVPLWSIVLLSIGCSFAPTYTLFLVFRFLSGACGAAICVVGFVLTVECVAASFRSVQALINSLVWVSGILTVGLLHLFIRNWRYLYLSVVVPGLFSIAYYWIFPESLHWLIANRKTKEVKRYIKRSSKMNKVTLNLHSCQSEIIQNQPQEEEIVDVGIQEQQRQPKNTRNFLDLCRSPSMLFHMLLNCYIYIVMNFVYWVLTLYSVKLHEQKMVGFFLSAVVEVPAGIVAMLMLFYCGRRTVTIVSLLGQALCLGLTIIFPQGSTPNLLLSLSAKVFNGVSWASEPLLLSEMAPTTVRNMMYGFVATVGEIGSVFAPYLERIGTENTQKIVITSMSALAILFALSAPETKGKSLPQDLTDFDGGPFIALIGRYFGERKRQRNNDRQNDEFEGENGEKGERQQPIPGLGPLEVLIPPKSHSHGSNTQNVV